MELKGQGQHERGMTPQQEIERLRRRVFESPEGAREMVKKHLDQSPEKFYAPEHLPSAEDLAEMEQRMMDVRFREKEEVINYLFHIVKEKGILNADKVAKKLDPALLDEFHDRLIVYIQREEK